MLFVIWPHIFQFLNQENKMYPKTSIFILYFMHVHTGYIHVHVNVSVFNCNHLKVKIPKEIKWSSLIYMWQYIYMIFKNVYDTGYILFMTGFWEWTIFPLKNSDNTRNVWETYKPLYHVCYWYFRTKSLWDNKLMIVFRSVTLSHKDWYLFCNSNHCTQFCNYPAQGS